MMKTNLDIEELKYPTGKFVLPAEIVMDQKEKWIQTIYDFPGVLNSISSDLSDLELSWIYRPEGWNVRQVIHHCADSHMNGLTRFKWALTEDNPTIKAYFEARWSLLADNLQCDIEYSLKIVEGVHKRWVHLMNSMNEQEWNKTFVHPENNFQYSLFQYLAQYAWHCDHHLAHIEQALRFKGQFP